MRGCASARGLWRSAALACHALTRRPSRLQLCLRPLPLRLCAAADANKARLRAQDSCARRCADTNLAITARALRARHRPQRLSSPSACSRCVAVAPCSRLHRGDAGTTSARAALRAAPRSAIPHRARAAAPSASTPRRVGGGRVRDARAVLVPVCNREAHARRGVLHAVARLRVLVDADAVRHQQVLHAAPTGAASAATSGATQAQTLVPRRSAPRCCAAGAPCGRSPR